MTSIYDFTARGMDGRVTSLGSYRDKTLLIVNVASKCGLTPQHEGLEALYRKFAEKGLVILGFPCNQFGHQEPGDSVEIRNFCSTIYDGRVRKRYSPTAKPKSIENAIAELL
jgi:glutathione peroxidase